MLSPVARERVQVVWPTAGMCNDQSVISVYWFPGRLGHCWDYDQTGDQGDSDNK